MSIHVHIIFFFFFSIILHFNSTKRRDSGSSLGSESLAWDVADVAAAALCKATGNDLVVTFHEVCMILIPDRPLLYIYIKPWSLFYMKIPRAFANLWFAGKENTKKTSDFNQFNQSSWSLCAWTSLSLIADSSNTIPTALSVVPSAHASHWRDSEEISHLCKQLGVSWNRVYPSHHPF